MDWGSSQQPDPAKHVRVAPLLSQPASQPTRLFHQPQKAQLWGEKSPKKHRAPPPVTFLGIDLYKTLRGGAVLDSAGKGKVKCGSILLI